MADEPLEVLVVHKMPDGTFAAADALQKLRIVQDGFKSAVEAEKFIEDFYPARGIIRPRKPEQ
jgi:hypothetical protein